MGRLDDVRDRVLEWFAAWGPTSDHPARDGIAGEERNDGEE